MEKIEVDFKGSDITAKIEDEDVKVTVTYNYSCEPETFDCPGGEEVADIEVLCDNEYWRDKFLNWCEDNTDYLCELAQEELESDFEHYQSQAYDRHVDRMLDER